jgi:hypothetical protein
VATPVTEARVAEAGAAVAADQASVAADKAGLAGQEALAELVAAVAGVPPRIRINWAEAARAPGRNDNAVSGRLVPVDVPLLDSDSSCLD